MEGDESAATSRTQGIWLDWINECSGDEDFMAVVRIPRGFFWMKVWRVWGLVSAWPARRNMSVSFDCSFFLGWVEVEVGVCICVGL